MDGLELQRLQSLESTVSEVSYPAPLGARDEDASRTLGEQYIRLRHRWAWGATLLGLALCIGGLTGFGVYGGRSNWLPKHGVHTTATVTSISSRSGRNGSLTSSKSTRLVAWSTSG